MRQELFQHNANLIVKRYIPYDAWKLKGVYTLYLHTLYLSSFYYFKVTNYCPKCFVGFTRTLPSNIASVSSTAALTLQLKRSPRIRMSGPVICTTLGCNADALDNRITSPKPCAACSFASGRPFSIASLKIGKIGVIPLGRQNPGKSSWPFRSDTAKRTACLMSCTCAICCSDDRVCKKTTRYFNN